MRDKNLYVSVMVFGLLLASSARPIAAQMPTSAAGLDGLGQKGPALSPLTQPTLSPGVILLMELEGRFAQAVAAGGGKAFAEWFAEDAVVLNNGQPATLGRGAIAAQAQWDPKVYQLTWAPQGAQMGPSNDMGFTWGHYEGHSKDKNGQPVVISGRYMTVWKKMPDGSWKVAMDASSNEPAQAAECCAVPKP
ncbi:ketosteroid isomerase-like protein [Edaphobacter modestus]|uniref:Ketosteroid isomerase-like protein n=2 Tax=Edaphobacter modestus TaxID=388466 RepID=A0A4Q7Z025_9BACT|nr:ketosteroid isomerase-like protein [Edaphobacter modestus]